MRAVVTWVGMLICLAVLGGCSTWQGPRLYTASDSVNPLPPGVYRVVQGEKRADYRWNGTQLTRISGKHRRDVLRGMLAVPLGLPGHDFYLVQFASDDAQQPDGAFYLLLGGMGDHFVLTMPDCATTETIVRDAGGVFDTLPHGRTDMPASKVRCHFDSRASLETAARRYATERALTGLHFTRIGD